MVRLVSSLSSHSGRMRDNKVVQFSDNVCHQVLVAQDLTNRLVIIFDGKADGSGETIEFIVVLGRITLASSFKTLVLMIESPFRCCGLSFDIFNCMQFARCINTKYFESNSPFLVFTSGFSTNQDFWKVKNHTNQDLHTPQKQHKSVLPYQLLPPRIPHTRPNASSILLQFIDRNPCGPVSVFPHKT